MIPEIGHFALCLALFVSLSLAAIPLWGAWRGSPALCGYARSAAYTLFGLCAFSFAALVVSFIQNDFTVSYVALHSNSFLPIGYRIAAVWGGHEGSLLLWVTILSTWMAAVAWFSKSLPLEMLARVLAVMGAISVGFLLFTLLTSNPFERLLPEFPLDGKDLNPLLQDFGLIVHPPMLYMGYVGFSVAFAFAVAGLLSGQLDSAWARWSRPWTTIAWCFLTIGIALGSWWAYYELGWGGWWFWDPVENASFMPWLTGTALIHSLAVTEKRGVFKAWTVLLALMAFSLSLLGTFLVRSGVLTSVHAFATDPERGVFILGFLILVIGGSLVLFALRASSFSSNQGYSPISREMFLLFNNILLMGVTTVVLLGTLFPLISDALGWGKISVGPPYFNLLGVPLAYGLMALMGCGMLVRWKRHGWELLWSQSKWPLVVSLVLGVLLPLCFVSEHFFGLVVPSVLALWVLFMAIKDVLDKTQYRSKQKSRSFLSSFWRLSSSYKGMLIAHIGLVVTLFGVAATSYLSVERDLRMAPGDEATVGAYTFVFDQLGVADGPNYTAQIGEFSIYLTSDPEKIEKKAVLRPEKRTYWATSSVMTEAGIDPSIFRDLYVALGEPLEDSVIANSWAVRVYVKPFVRWLWLGAILMALGGMLAIADKRYRKR